MEIQTSLFIRTAKVLFVWRHLSDTSIIKKALIISISYRKKISGLVLLAFLFTTGCVAQSLKKTMIADTNELSIFWDSCQLRLDKSIVEKDYWFKILKEDTVLISFFKARAKNKPTFISISSIEQISGTVFQYAFNIYSRNLIIDPNKSLGLGHATYFVLLIPTTNGQRIISEIK
jgi:hypothetical protein